MSQACSNICSSNSMTLLSGSLATILFCNATLHTLKFGLTLVTLVFNLKKKISHFFTLCVLACMFKSLCVCMHLCTCMREKYKNVLTEGAIYSFVYTYPCKHLCMHVWLLRSWVGANECIWTCLGLTEWIATRGEQEMRWRSFRLRGTRDAVSSMRVVTWTGNRAVSPDVTCAEVIGKSLTHRQGRPEEHHCAWWSKVQDQLNSQQPPLVALQSRCTSKALQAC